MFLPVDLKAIRNIRKEGATYLSLLPNEIFQLIIDYFKNDTFVITDPLDCNTLLDFLTIGNSFKVGSEEVLTRVNNSYCIVSGDSIIINVFTNKIMILKFTFAKCSYPYLGNGKEYGKEYGKGDGKDDDKIINISTSDVFVRVYPSTIL